MKQEGKCTADTSLCQTSCRSVSAVSALKFILKHFSYDSYAERLASYCNVLKHMVGFSAVGKTKINCFEEWGKYWQDFYCGFFFAKHSSSFFNKLAVLVQAAAVLWLCFSKSGVVKIMLFQGLRVWQAAV